jgi:DNA-binding MarR family transcriptional regulator
MPIAEARITGCTCDRLRKLARRLTQRYDAYLAPTGLRLTQFSLLAHLMRGEPLTMSALAGLLEMDRTTLTRNLKPLADAGLVALDAGRDARERVVSVSEQGRTVWRAARDQWRRAQEDVNQVLGVEQVIALHAVLDGSLETLRNRTRGGAAARKRA